MPHAEALVAFLAGRQVHNATHTVHAKLGDAIRHILHQLRGSGLTPVQLREVYASPESVVRAWRSELASALPGELDDLLSTVASEDGARKLVSAMKDGGYRPPEWLKPSFLLFDESAASHTCGLMQLSLLAWDWIETQMLDRQELDFTLLESHAVRLVENDPATAERIKKQFRALLVDEAQDVNPVQYRLLAALNVESEMMVGDPQQSIYGFRLADRELFIKRTTSRPSLKLSRNHRSVPGILRFVDDFFTRVWREDYQAMSAAPVVEGDDPFGTDVPLDYSGVEVWPQDAKDTAGVAAGIEQLVKSGHAARTIAVLTRQNWTSHEIADKLALRGIATRVIGGAERFYTRLEVRDVANALDALADPYADFQMLALLRSPFVELSLDSLVLLALNRPIIDCLAEFEPPIAEDKPKIEEFLAWFNAVRPIAARVPAWEVLSEVLRRTAYLETIASRPNGEQALANVRKLFSKAAEEPLLNAQQFAEKVREVQELRHREGDAPSIDEDADAVTLMTIHRAKGLEFEVVVLPDMHKRFGKSPSDILSDARTGIVCTKFNKLDTVVWKWLSSKLSDIERHEELRVLYVGMTRARKKLCVVTSTSPSERTPAGLVTARMGLNDGERPGLVVRKLLE
jgi:ATP-dependent exoDNAse (exonuclease V) beta subunit